MTRARLVLALGLIAAALAFGVAWFRQTQLPPDTWIGRRFGLEGSDLETFAAAHRRYAIACDAMCRKIHDADQHLAHLIVAHRELTPEIRDAMARSDSLRSQCRQAMLTHFYDMAALLDPAHRHDYLRMVLPLVVEPSRMAHDHDHGSHASHASP